jgi:hypothetical protein
VPSPKKKSHRHPSQDRTNRFARDALLREAGFSIFFRGKGEPLWMYNNRIYNQTQAEAFLDQDALADAEYMEFLYYEDHPV